MLTNSKKNKIQPWFCESCNKDKKLCKKCLEDTYQELREILDKDILDDVIDDYF